MERCVRGQSVREIAVTSRQILLGDPRLLRDLGDAEVSDLNSVSDETWVNYWRKWPIAHLANDRR